MAQQYSWPFLSVPAPVGGATAANQVLEIAQLTAINANTDGLEASNTAIANSTASIDTKTPTVGQKTMANSSPVVIASDQSAVPASQSGTWNINNISGAITLPTGAATETTLSAINTKTPALGQALMAASVPVVLASNQTALAVTQPSVVSTANSSTATLAISGVFTGISENVQDYATIEINVFSDVASAALGLSIQQSSNGTNWDIIDTYTIPAATGKVFCIGPGARFFRIVYTNGATGQAAFRLQTVFHYNTVRASSHSLAETITNQNDAELVIAQLRGSDGTNAVPVLVDASGRPAANIAQINGVAPLMGNGVTGTGSLRVTLASDTSSNTNPLLVLNARAATSTLTNVTASASNVTVLALNANRKAATIYNDSTATLYLKWGATASATSFTVLILGGSYYELPGPTVYTGILDGIWSSATGAARVTELT